MRRPGRPGDRCGEETRAAVVMDARVTSVLDDARVSIADCGG